MRLVIAAVGLRQPAWADAAYDDFAKRFPAEMRLELKAVKAEPREAARPRPSRLMAAEAKRLEERPFPKARAAWCWTNAAGDSARQSGQAL